TDRVAHRGSERLRQTLHHLEVSAIAVRDLKFRVCVSDVVPPAAERTAAPLMRRDQHMVFNHDLCPDIIDVKLIGIVDHIRQKAARRTHVDLQSEDIAPFAQSVPVFLQAEKLKVEEAAAGRKCPYTAGADLQDVGRNVDQGVTADAVLTVDRIHDGADIVMTGRKLDLFLAVGDAVKGETGARYVFFDQHRL